MAQEFIHTKHASDSADIVDRINALLNYLQINSPYYRAQFSNLKIPNPCIKQLSDLRQFTFTTKEDLQRNNDAFFCQPLERIAEYTASSGTLGSPVTIGLTRNDLIRLQRNELHSFQLMGVGPGDIVQLMLTLDRQFMAGLAYHQGAIESGAGVIRTGPALPSMQLEIAERLGSTVWVAVPSFLIRIKQYAREKNINLNTLPVRKILCIGEGIRDEDFTYNELGRQITDDWQVQLFCTYASTEMQTAFTECTAACGGHVQPDLVYVEFIGDDGLPVADGEYGEVCVTTLGVEGTPLLRFLTGDICRANYQPCSCGRASWRISPVRGRKKQMIKFKGTTLYPPALFDVLNQCAQIVDYVVEARSNALGLDELIIHVHTLLPVDHCEKELKPFLQARLRVLPELHYISSSELHHLQFPPGSRKLIRFIDHRKA